MGLMMNFAILKLPHGAKVLSGDLMKYLSVGIRALPCFALLLTSGCLLSGVMAGRERRFVFVDGGAHYGEALLAFKRSGSYRGQDWEMYAIEANPSEKVLAALRAIPGVSVIGKAIWTHDGFIDLYLAPDDSQNSLFSASVANPTGSVKVECFDFSRWVRESFSKNDLLVVSLDIQGAERGVLEKMVSDGTYEYVDVLMVEGHLIGGEGPAPDRADPLEAFRESGTIVFGNSAESVDLKALDKAVSSRF